MLSESLSPNEKNDFTFWLIFGLSPNLELSESLSEKLNVFATCRFCQICLTISLIVQTLPGLVMFMRYVKNLGEDEVVSDAFGRQERSNKMTD